MASNVLENLNALGIKTSFLTNTEKSVKTRYIDERSQQQLLRVDNDVITNEIDLTNVVLSQYDMIVVSDYNKGFVSDDTILFLIANYKGPIFVDTKKKDMGMFSAENIYFKINEKECKEAESLSKYTIVTYGKNGAMYGNVMFQAPKVDTFDVTGAGDTFLAALAWSYHNWKDIQLAIKMANKAASISVQYRGVYTLNPEDVYEIGRLRYEGLGPRTDLGH